MEQLIGLALWVVGAVVLMSLIYRLVPFREIRSERPRLAFFPKYTAAYSGTTDHIISNLSKMGFLAVKGKPHFYTRGKAYGDFSVKALQLHASIDESKQRVNVYAPYIGVFFDTGDLWQIAADAVRANQP